MSVNSLSNRHAKVLREILEHRTPANLEWHDVLSLMEDLGSARERHDGKYEFRIGNRPHIRTSRACAIAALFEAALVVEKLSMSNSLICSHRTRTDSCVTKERSKQVDDKGEHTPDVSEYYERIVERLKGMEPIIILTDANANAGAFTYLNEHLEKRHKDILNRVVATEGVDPGTVTAGDIKQIAERHLKQ